MIAPFYLVFIPVLVLVGGGLLGLYLLVVRDPETHLEHKIKSDLEEAQELERLEREAESHLN